ncbi:MAG TPA: glycosyltransferase, partial [Elusimicrobiota bacterium]|nr:glycosyltransferase [Elusimicrobiota bacterium]
DVIGGSESYTFQLANLLSFFADVDILTTTAKDHFSWKNHFPEGIEVVSDHLRIRRFTVDFERTQHWFELNRILLNGVPMLDFAFMEPAVKQNYVSEIRKIPAGFQEEWMRQQGPYSSALLDYLKNHADYDHYLFMTYLYPTTYFGVDQIAGPKKIHIIPTLHDEVPAYLNIMQKYARLKFLFLTRAESRLAQRIFHSEIRFDIIGYGLPDRFASIKPFQSPDPYILYAGRLDPSKGVEKLYEYFKRFVKKHPQLKLYTIGDGPLKEEKHPNIRYMGFVDETQKLALMGGALSFVHPSSFESLGIVLLESFMMGTPGLVNKRCEVLNDHILESGAGFSYDTYEGFENSLMALLDDSTLRDKLGSNARKYYLERYSVETAQSKLAQILGTIGSQGEVSNNSATARP